MPRQPFPTLDPARKHPQKAQQSDPLALPLPWLSSEAESGRQNQLPRAGSWGQGSVWPRLHRSGNNHLPLQGTHLSPGSPPAPPGRQLLPLLGPELSCPRWGRGVQPPPSARFSGPAPAGGQEGPLCPKIGRLWALLSTQPSHCPPPGWSDSHCAGSSLCARGTGE